MESGSKRWEEITPSEYAHERGGLAAIRAKLDDEDPYRAWSNFSFTTRSGRQYEVDLLVIGKGGIYLLELKHWSGRIVGDHQTWLHNGTAEDHPRILADIKAKHFKQLLIDAGGRDLPFVHAGVVLHQPTAEVRLTDRGRKGVYRIDGQGPAGLDELIADELAVTPSNPHNAIDRRRSVELARLINKAGVRPSVRHRRVGNLELTGAPLAEGPGWQDYLARHPMLESARRVRFYLVDRGVSEEERAATLRAAKREFVTLENVNHPGIARALEFYEHERGLAVVFEHDATEIRLDHFLMQKADELSIDQRVGLVRTLANTLRYAHSRRLVHRRLSPLSIFVRSFANGRYGVRVRDWHTAGRLSPGSPGYGSYAVGTRTLEALTDRAAHGYLAPETLHDPAADPILADVFGLGSVSFLIFTGKAPADTGEELQQRLTRERGLDIGVELDGASQTLIDLIRNATAGDVDLRTESTEKFAQEVEALVREFLHQEEAAQRVDPLDATPGSVIGTGEQPGRFEVVQRLGQGSTALALLVKDPEHGQAVLKVALDEDSARRRLLDESEVLHLAREPRIARSLEGPLVVGGRTALLLEDAGRESLAAMIRREGRLSLDFLSRWGRDLLEILAALDLAGINHRDIKPDNLAFRERGKSREVHLSLFDFSLSRAPLEQTGVGTPPYLDPFFDPVHRPRYDAAAERYAAAVTLYEMATGRTPTYGTGGSHPAVIESDVTIDPGDFEPGPARDGLVAFFRSALSRDVKARHESIEEMRIAWQTAFESVPPAAATPTSVNPVTGEELDQAASKAVLDTAIASSGLTPRAVDALHRIDVRTVRDLLARSPFELSRLSGVADPTKREIRRRAKQWRGRLQPATETFETADLQDDSERGVGAVLGSLVPKSLRGDSAEAQVLRLYLGLEDTDSDWPSNAELAQATGVTAGRVGQIVPKARKGWRSKRSLTRVRDEIVDIVEDAGGVVAATGIAEALLASRSPDAAGERWMRRALGLVRAAVEVETERGGEARLLQRHCHGSVIVALEKPTDPDAVPGTDLLDYAVRLGRAADHLIAESPLPSAAHTEGRLRAVRLPQGAAELPAERLALLAAAASRTAAANGRGEVYPDGLDPRLALEQMASSLGVVRHGMNAEQLKARVRARYPKVGPFPQDPPGQEPRELNALLKKAGVPLVFARGHGTYEPRRMLATILPSSRSRVGSSLSGNGGSRELADFERRMELSARERGFVTLAVNYRLYLDAVAALSARFGAEVLDITAELLTAMRQTAQTLNVDWSLVLRSDRPDAAPQDAANLRRLVALAATGLEERLTTETRPLLIVEAAPLARYERLAVLERLADKATARPAARWLLLPVERGGMPHIDDRPAPGALGALPVSAKWVEAHSRSAAS